MEDKNVIEDSLLSFTGSLSWTRHGIFPVYLTDGAKYVAKACEAYWLMDIICSWQLDERVKKEEFQVWMLTVNEDGSAVVVAEDGNGNEIARQEIEWTDFPLNTITLWVEWGGPNGRQVILLPSEH